MVIVSILFFLIIIYFELLPIYKGKKIKEARIYFCIIFLCFLISVLISMGIKIPSPSSLIKNMVNIVIDQ